MFPSRHGDVLTPTPTPFVYLSDGWVGGGKHGSLHVNGEVLLAMFGAPNGPPGDGDGKTKWQWTLELDTGEMVCIWDWKTFASRPQDVDSWSIGFECPEARAAFENFTGLVVYS